MPPRAELSALSLKGRALRYLAAREHSRAELERKLSAHLPKDADPETLTRVLDELAAKALISEARVAESVLNRRAARLGSARVLNELRAKHLSDEVMASAAEQLRATEQARAMQVWQTRFGQPPGNAAERARQIRFLAGRGFSGDVIRHTLTAADARQAEND
ncbi:MAG: recombination regulator RecX [Burkholderiaceae bacterium]|jgi:regulatory protein|nr:recombination regulator RecX [Burkholderiaceae bacterium]